MKTFSPLALLLFVLVGCSSEVLTPAGSDGVGGSGGSGGGQPTTGGVGGSSACAALPEDGVVWSLSFEDGDQVSPAVGPADKLGDVLERSFEGEVVETSAGQVVVDTCPPNADCAGTLVKLDVSLAKGAFDAEIPLHTFVSVHLVSRVVGYPTGGQAPYRTLLLEIDNLPAWAGVTNPTEPGTAVWMIASDEGVSQTGTSAGPIGVAYEKLCEGSVDGYYQLGQLSFWELATPAHKVTLAQGKSGAIDLAGSPRPLLIYNLDSSIERIEGSWAPDFIARRVPTVD